MSDVLCRGWSTGIVCTFFTGLLVFLPLVLSLVILRAGDLMPGVIRTFIGPNRSMFAYLPGMLIAPVIIWFFGVVVTCRFGGDSNAGLLALLTAPKVFEFNGERRQLVYLPTSPLPMSGALLSPILASVPAGIGSSHVEIGGFYSDTTTSLKSSMTTLRSKTSLFHSLS